MGASVVAVSTDQLSRASGTARQLGILFPILYDPSTEVPRTYGVFDLLGDRLAAPATFIIDRGGQIRWKYVGRRNSDRPSVATVLGHLRDLR